MKRQKEKGGKNKLRARKEGKWVIRSKTEMTVSGENKIGIKGQR